VPASTSCLNASIADVRALRAAAFPPRVVALTLIVVSPVAIAAGSGRAVLAWMVAGAEVRAFDRRPPLFYCSKYRNETAYGMVLDEILRRHFVRLEKP